METIIRIPRCRRGFALWAIILLGLALATSARAQSTVQSNPLSTVTVLHSFTSEIFQTTNNVDGSSFPAPLILGSDGNFYGVAQSGGPNGNGTVFRVTRTGVLTVLFVFESGNVNNTGAGPSGALIEDPAAPGTFYGTTQSGGDNASGTIFKLVTTGTVTETILHSFGDPGTPNDGIIPAGALALRAGILYGTAAGGGAHGNAGAIYKIGTNGTGYTILHSFASATDGSNPRGLVLGSALYGVTHFGGSAGAGAVWALGTDGLGFQTLYTFGGSDGYSKPALSLALAGDGTLYGSFGVGTPDGYGGIFKISPQGAFSLLHAFVYDFNTGVFEGGWPGPVTLGADGNLYGQLGKLPFNTSSDQFNPGFAHQHFQIRTSDGALTLLASTSTRTFAEFNGESELTAAPDGTLYGLENLAGATSFGDVIQLRPAPAHILTVSKTSDDAGSINDPTTLRGAIRAAQPGDAIVFSPDIEGAQSTITLTQGELAINQDLNIAYTPTALNSSLTLDATGVSRIFHIGGGIVDISNLTMTNGFAQTQGGGVLIDGSAAVYLSGSMITNCAVTGSASGEGGGLCLVSGDLTFGGTIRNCSAAIGGGIAVDTGQVVTSLPLPGGAILNFFTDDTNKAMEGGGLAIRYSGPVGAYFGSFSHDQAGDNGGGVYDVGGQTFIQSTTLANDIANGLTINAGAFSPLISSGRGAGGGIYNAGGREVLQNDVFSNDSAYSAGALDITTDPTAGAGYAKIYFTTFSGNTAVLSVGGDTQPGPLNGDGGAITVDGGTLDLLQSTVGGLASLSTAGNHADADGGGIYIGSGTATINDITFYGNSAARRGGAVFNSAAHNTNVSLYYSTVTNNDAAAGGGLYEDFNAESPTANPFTVYSAILAQNTLAGSSAPVPGQDAAVALGGTFTSNGSNIIGNGAGATGLNNNGVNHDQVGNVGGAAVLDPLLFPLANYGGSTLTRAVEPGSPALHASFNIDNDIYKFDQRGVQRPFPNPYDIGAAEHPAPTVQQDFYFTTENTALGTPAPGVLSNDYADLNESPNPYPLTATIATMPTHGAVTLNPDGSFTYTPSTSFIGTDSFTYIAHDPIAQSVPATVTISVTGAVPTTTAALSGTLGSSGYYRSAVTVTLSATDPNYASSALTTTYSVDGGAQQTYAAPATESNPASGTGPFAVSADGIHTVTFFSTDPVGSAEVPQSVTINIDATPPTLTFGTPTPAPNASGYTNTPVRIPYTAADATSGVSTVTPSSPIVFSTEGKAQTQTVTVTDSAGNTAAFTSPPISIDLTKPVTTAVTQTVATGTQVTLTGTDNLSGVASTVYSVDSGQTQPYTTPFTVQGNGPHMVTFHSVDNAGNAEANETINIMVNISAPVTTASLAGPQGANGYYAGPVKVTLAAQSTQSTVIGTFYTVDGGAQQSYTVPFTVSGDAAHTIVFHSTDAAGNSESPNQQSFKIDSTPPVTTASLSGPQAASTAQGALRPQAAVNAVYTGPVTITLAPKDNFSGVAVTTYTIDNGPSQTYTQPFVVSALGTHTLSFSSTDNAGNVETTQTRTFTVVSLSTRVLHAFTTGLYLFSVPKDMTGIPLTQTFDQPGIKLAVWLPQILQYVLTPTPPSDGLRPGQGYWARFGQATNLYDLGTPTPTNAPFTIPIHIGWNMIGDPFPVSAPPSSLRVQTSTGTFTLNDSVARILLSPTFYSYDTPGGQYQAHALPTDALVPYIGYWLYSRCDGNLIVNTP